MICSTELEARRPENERDNDNGVFYVGFAAHLLLGHLVEVVHVQLVHRILEVVPQSLGEERGEEEGCVRVGE